MWPVLAGTGSYVLDFWLFACFARLPYGDSVYRIVYKRKGTVNDEEHTTNIFKCAKNKLELFLYVINLFFRVDVICFNPYV